MKDKHLAKITKESGPKRPQKVKRVQHEQICVEKRFTDLLHLIDHLGNNIRPTTAGNKHSLQMVKHLISCTQNVIRDCSKGVEKNMGKLYSVERG